MTVDEAIAKLKAIAEACGWSHAVYSSIALQDRCSVKLAIETVLTEFDSQRREIEELRRRLLTAAGDDLCRLTQEEIKQLSSGAVPIPPREEFLASCERFHAQIANESGVNSDCLTLAQLIAENERLNELVYAYESTRTPEARK